MASDDVWTVARVAKWAAEDFRTRGVPSPRLEADILLAHVLGVDRIRILTDPDKPLAPTELAAYRELIRRRRQHEPVAYLLGEREFYGRSFRVDKRVLIPRPDTETLVEVALRRAGAHTLGLRTLDLCTGSGCVAITLLRERPTWHVDGLDVSPDALALAAENAQRLSAIWNLRWQVSDLFASLDPATDRYGLITANPPYIPHSEIATLEPHIRNFEPLLALDGGPSGLGVVERIVAEAPAYLEAGGVLALELMAGQAPAVATLMERAGYEHLEVTRDYGGHERVISGVWRGDGGRG